MLAQGTVYKAVIKNAAYIFFIKLFPAFASIAVLILYSRVLTPEDYGAYQDFWVKLLLTGTFAYAGLPVAIITYPADMIRFFAGQIQRRHYLSFLLWSLSWCAVFAFLESTVQLPFFLGVFLVLLYVIHSVQEALLMSAKKMSGLLLINFLYAAYFLLMHFSLLRDYDLVRLLWWLMAGMLARTILITVTVVQIYRRIVPVSGASNVIVNARKLWLHLGFYDLIQTIFRYIDKFVLAQLLSVTLFAVYFNGAQSAEVPFLPYLLGAVASSVLIQLSGNQHDPASYKLLRMSGKVLASIVFPLFFFLWFFSTEIFSIVFTDKYAASVPVFLAAILVLPLRAYSYTTLLQHLHKGAIINKGAVLDLLLALLLMYPFYRFWDLPGVALSFVFSTYIQVAYYLWHTSRLTGVPVSRLLPLRNWLIKMLGFGLAIGLLSRILPYAFSNIPALVTAFCCTVVLSVCSLWQEWRGMQSTVEKA